ncbi:MAG: hypothetical protein LBU85_00590 [Treponema sp.]|jgi:hypothetical protein|nr:hypothetical protein [Treponema sp.]
MKKYFNFIIIAFLFFSCNNGDPKVDPEKIIGKDFDLNSLPYGDCGLYEHKTINGVKYLVHGVYYKKKVLVYVLNSEGIKDYFFSNFVKFNKVKNIPLGTSYEVIVDMLGEPVGKYYGTGEEIKNGEKVHLAIVYFQKMEYTRKISQMIVELEFDKEGKLVYVNEVHTAP